MSTVTPAAGSLPVRPAAAAAGAGARPTSVLPSEVGGSSLKSIAMAAADDAAELKRLGAADRGAAGTSAASPAALSPADVEGSRAVGPFEAAPPKALAGGAASGHPSEPRVLFKVPPSNERAASPGPATAAPPGPAMAAPPGPAMAASPG
ncbi:MAG TPA: hypothetical protein VFS00_09100, partial [Polyangiaceae bacterium]|nr:hypothetical protein [Polyangiaceae bacterium]